MHDQRVRTDVRLRLDPGTKLDKSGPGVVHSWLAPELGDRLPGLARGGRTGVHMATKAELQAQLEALTQELNALRDTKAKPGAKRGKGLTKLQKANRKAGRATNMRYACDACSFHSYHEAKSKAHVCKAGGKSTKIKV